LAARLGVDVCPYGRYCLKGERLLDVERLIDLVRSDAAVGYLQTYYGSGLGPNDVPLFTGARFEFLDGGGARECVADKFTASDLLL
jgi:hypothetical protein